MYTNNLTEENENHKQIFFFVTKYDSLLYILNAR